MKHIKKSSKKSKKLDKYVESRINYALSQIKKATNEELDRRFKDDSISRATFLNRLISEGKEMQAFIGSVVSNSKDKTAFNQAVNAIKERIKIVALEVEQERKFTQEVRSKYIG